MNKSPLVSIIMAVYNAGAYVDSAIQSVLRQRYVNWELIVVNDGSTDDSLAVIRQFKDPRIVVLNQMNYGVSHARNKGLERMRGDFFCFLDADDVLPPESLSIRMKCFSDSSVAFVDGCVEVFDVTMTKKLRLWAPMETPNILRSLIRLDGRCFFGPTWMMRTSSLSRFQFDEALTHCEDLHFFMINASAGKYTFTNQVILHYRTSPHSAMGNLHGLANGYSLLRRKIKEIPERVSFVDRVIFNLRVRKIIFLSFLNSRDWRFGFRYLIFGYL